MGETLDYLEGPEFNDLYGEDPISDPDDFYDDIPHFPYSIDKVVWEDPPPPRGVGNRTKHRNRENKHGTVRRQAMKDNPGRWLLWGVFAGAGSSPTLRKNGFEVTSRKDQASGLTRLYVRWPE